MRVGEGLAECEPHLMTVEDAPKQDRQQLHRRLRVLADGKNLFTARGVMCGKCIDARVQPEERKVMRRQHEGLRRYLLAQLGERAQIARQRIAVRLVSLDADVGRDLGQHLVARDQDPGLGTIKTGELGRMAFTDNYPPIASADLDLHPILEPLKIWRHGGDTTAIAVFPGRRRDRSTPDRARRDGRSWGAAGQNRRYPGSLRGRTAI